VNWAYNNYMHHGHIAPLSDSPLSTTAF